MREITREINYNFPVGALYPDIKPFLVFSTHSQVPTWVQTKAPTYKVLLQNLQLVSYLPSLREFEPITFKGSQSESQIGAQVAEIKRKYNVENQYAIEWILYSGDIVLARDYLYNLRQVKYLNLKTPYLTPEIDAVVGFDFNTTLSLKIRGQSLLNDGVDYLYITGWYTVLISYDEISIDGNFTDVNSKLTTINNSIVTTNTALTSINNATVTTNNNLISLWSGLNTNTGKLGTLEAKVNTLQTTVNSILFILENATFSPNPSPTPNPTPTPTPQNEDDMPYFASKQALIDNNSTYVTGQNIILDNNGTDIYLYIDGVNSVTGNFPDDTVGKLAFNYKTGAFVNISNPVWNGTFSSFKYMPSWLIDIFKNKEVTVRSENEVFINRTSWEKVLIEPSSNMGNNIPPLRTLFIENPTFRFSLVSKYCELENQTAVNRANFSSVRNVIYALVNNKLVSGDKIRFRFANVTDYSGQAIYALAEGQDTSYDQYAENHFIRIEFLTWNQYTGIFTGWEAP